MGGKNKKKNNTNKTQEVAPVGGITYTQSKSKKKSKGENNQEDACDVTQKTKVDLQNLKHNEPGPASDETNKSRNQTKNKGLSAQENQEPKLENSNTLVSDGDQVVIPASNVTHVQHKVDVVASKNACASKNLPHASNPLSQIVQSVKAKKCENNQPSLELESSQLQPGNDNPNDSPQYVKKETEDWEHNDASDIANSEDTENMPYLQSDDDTWNNSSYGSTPNKEFSNERRSSRNYRDKNSRDRDDSWHSGNREPNKLDIKGQKPCHESSDNNNSQNVRKSQRHSSPGHSGYQQKFSRKNSCDRSCEDADYNHFQNSIMSSDKDVQYNRVKEKFGDLFAQPDDYALAHCVAEDFNMGSGIAVTFRQNYKGVDELLQAKQKTGGLAFLERKGRYIYYLVTKKTSSGKPTLYDLWRSLQKLKAEIKQHGVKKLAVPRIGCGLDRLEWSDVKQMLEYVFKDTDLEILVCYFQQNHGQTKQKLQQISETTKCHKKEESAKTKSKQNKSNRKHHKGKR